ncbi:PREDICTED: amyloid-like protein 2 isoform X4 [Branchiostoma belcheri]|uniref:Amyloid-like protein 2 isoform X4 n=1 Tax=Branchiostoma belcheri TaxID=7741 RepID=A0A6P4ZRH8_BRABE|nr:PREDICTED: amyloid-like protein 2 isoform X4 [Branchiostoma belcheri]KAI8483892.1 Amyloid-like protein 2 [Branchiostoma belcheri]
MAFRASLWSLLFVGILSVACGTYIEALAATYDSAKPDPIPMVAMVKDKMNQHINLDSGKWETDPTGKHGYKDKPQDILDYCKLMYPNLEITNIEEHTKEIKIENWCKPGSTAPCGGHPHKVRPFRCLVGRFESDALMVPTKCKFSHIHNSSVCTTFFKWRDSAKEACDKSGFDLHNFAMLKPCGVDLFTGVEFVCCPTKPVQQQVSLQDVEPVKEVVSNPCEDGSHECSDFADCIPQSGAAYTCECRSGYIGNGRLCEEEIFQEEVPPSPTPKAVDPYFLEEDSDNEHKMFLEARKRVEEKHRLRMTQVMKQWEEAEERYQELKSKDPNGAELMKKEMMERFQVTVNALEQEGQSEREQLLQTHQQRVETMLNNKKRVAMEDYMDALGENPPHAHKILRALKAYIHAEQKDRLHSMRHFEHVRETMPEKTADMKPSLIQHLRVIDERINQSIQLLWRLPSIAKKIMPELDVTLPDKPLKETPKKPKSSEKEEDTENTKDNKTPKSDPLLTGAKQDLEADRQIINPEDLPVYQRPEPLVPIGILPVEVEQDIPDLEDQRINDILKDDDDKPAKVDYFGDDEEDEDAEGEGQAEKKVLVTPQHLQKFAASKADRPPQAASFVKKSQWNKHMSNITNLTTLSITVAAAIIAVIIIVALIVLRKKHAPMRQPGVNHAVVEVDPSMTPEERHVSKMQQNGYENPTYKYFEQSQQ